MFSSVQYQKKGYTGIIDMNIPVNGRIEIALLSEELNELCAEVTRDEEIRVVMLTGDRRNSFSIEPVSGFKDERSLAEPIAKLDRPLIAAIQGDAIGQGLELALACDIRIATEASHFGLPHIKTGLIPGDGGIQRLSRLIGKGKALELILTGELIDAKEAYRIGLVSKVVSADHLMAVTMDMAKEMASKGPIASRYAKEAIHKGMDLTLKQGLRLEADLYLLLHTTKDRTEGISAFREKRKPNFEGK